MTEQQTKEKYDTLFYATRAYLEGMTTARKEAFGREYESMVAAMRQGDRTAPAAEALWELERMLREITGTPLP